MKRILLILAGVLLLTGILLNGQFVNAGNSIMRMLTGKEQATLWFHSFDGGGPRYIRMSAIRWDSKTRLRILRQTAKPISFSATL